MKARLMMIRFPYDPRAVAIELEGPGFVARLDASPPTAGERRPVFGDADLDFVFETRTRGLSRWIRGRLDTASGEARWDKGSDEVLDAHGALLDRMFEWLFDPTMPPPAAPGDVRAAEYEIDVEDP